MTDSTPVPVSRPQGPVRRHARRASVAVVGGCTVALGVVLIPLPGPGSLVILAGLSILGREFPKARRAADQGKGWANAALDSARRGASRLGWVRTETDTTPPEP